MVDCPGSLALSQLLRADYQEGWRYALRLFYGRDGIRGRGTVDRKVGRLARSDRMLRDLQHVFQRRVRRVAGQCLFQSAGDGSWFAMVDANGARASAFRARSVGYVVGISWSDRSSCPVGRRSTVNRSFGNVLFSAVRTVAGRSV